MDRQTLQRKVGISLLSLTFLALISVVVDRLAFRGFTVNGLLTDSSFIGLFLVAIGVSLCTFISSKITRLGLSLGTFFTSAPMILSNGPSSYFGLGTIIVGSLLLYRFGFLERYMRAKALGILVWTLFWVIYSNQMVFPESPAVSISSVIFIGFNLLLLYILFEEEIRDLLAANRSKDVTLAEQAAEIARLEPLSVLGERVAHVAHSFKNNLNQVSTALFLLEQVNDPGRAAEKIREFSKTLNERIENILMVSRAGVDLEPELFDVARVLEGMKQVYLQEKSFVEKCRTVLTVEGPVLVHAVRWDFILMVENILKNALEAISTCNYYGTIRIDLARGQLTIANDGGPIPLCADCHDDCLRCPRYGKPGQTTKKGGSGHGLAQVFATCRANGWGLKLRAQENWTLFEIRFPGRPTT